MPDQKPPRLSSPRTQRWLLWIGGFVLAAGIAAVLIVFLRDTGTTTPEVFKNEPPTKVAPKPKPVPLEPAVRRVAGDFILTAVQRKNLDKAWALAGPQIRQDLTYKEWLTGDIPVIPFLKPLKLTSLKVDLSSKNYAMIELILLPKKGRGEIYVMELNKVGKGDKAHWVVNSWVPRSHPTIPTNQSS